MTSFVVLQHDDEPDANAMDKTIFVRDAFSITALAFPIVWLFWHRLWVAGGCALLLFIAVVAFTGQNPNYFWLLFAFNVLLSVVVATEGSAWRMVALRLAGYKDLTIVEAENLEQAQLVWTLHEQDVKPAMVEKRQPLPRPKYEDDLIFGANEQS